MDFTKEYTLKDMMQFAQDLKELQKNLDMVKEFMGDIEFKTIKKQ